MRAMTITQKGQVTIPVDIRRFLRIQSGEQVVFFKKKNQVILKPAKDFLLLKGSIKKTQRYDDQKANKKVFDLISKKHVW